MRLTRCLAILGLVLALQGCMDSTVLGYESLTYELDDKSELHISTYPAGFPRETSIVPYLYKKLRTPDAVYFQIFVRAIDKKWGPNPYIETIRIRSFSYQFPGQEPVELVSDFDGGFWMQGDLTDNPGPRTPVPHDEHWFLQVKVDLSLNGRDHVVDEQIHAYARRRLRPLLLYLLR